MGTKQAIKKAIKLVGKKGLSEHLGISYQAVDCWAENNRMPDTEYSGRTSYSVLIEDLTEGAVDIKSLLGYVPVCVAIKYRKKITRYDHCLDGDYSSMAKTKSGDFILYADVF